MCPARRKERGIVILLERLTTQPGAKIVSALRVATEIAPRGVARGLFRITKRFSSRLIDAFSATTEAEIKDQQALVL